MNETRERKTEELDAGKFIKEQVKSISEKVRDGTAISALSGGIDSAVVTLLAHKAIGDRLKAYFIENGIMREGEAQQVVEIFREFGVDVKVVDASKDFFEALRGISDPEKKREAITQTFYKKVFSRIVKESGAKFLLQGTILTDIEETGAGIERQHNVFKQIGIDPEEAFGYQIIEPLVQLRKDGVRKIGEAIGFKKDVFNRIPFPGPALAARVIGETTPEKISLVRQATKIVEEELSGTGAFQYMAILHEDRVTGIRNGKRDFGMQIEVRCWESTDARKAIPTELPYKKLMALSQRITREVKGVVSVTYNITTKPPSTIEAV